MADEAMRRAGAQIVSQHDGLMASRACTTSPSNPSKWASRSRSSGKREPFGVFALGHQSREQGPPGFACMAGAVASARALAVNEPIAHVFSHRKPPQETPALRPERNVDAAGTSAARRARLRHPHPCPLTGAAPTLRWA